MTRRQEEFLIQELIDILHDCTLKGIGKEIGVTENIMRSLYHSTGKRSLTRAQEQKLHDFIDQKIRKMIKLIKRMEKHQLPMEGKML